MFKPKSGYNFLIINVMLIKLYLLLHIKMQIVSCYVCENVNMLNIFTLIIVI